MLTADGLEVIPADSGGVNVNNFLGGPGDPAATSANFIGLSTTIAAHELGHLSGLEHADSFGPIGSGIYAGVNPDLYNPPYPGPIGADESILDIMASGASVNATLEDAINDPFFSERDAIALSFGESGSPTNEETTAHYSICPTPSRSRSSRWSCPIPTSREQTPIRCSTSPPPTSSVTWAKPTEHRTPTIIRSPPRPAA